jgi:hypothetical protein
MHAFLKTRESLLAGKSQGTVLVFENQISTCTTSSPVGFAGIKYPKRINAWVLNWTQRLASA